MGLSGWAGGWGKEERRDAPSQEVHRRTPFLFHSSLGGGGEKRRGAAGVQALACRRESFCGEKLACLPVRDGDGWGGVGGWVGLEEEEGNLP